MEQSVILAQSVQLRNYMNVSVGSVLVYNYLLSLPEEIDYLWTRRGMGLGKVLFILTRYLPFVSTPLAIGRTYACHLFFQRAMQLTVAVVLLFPGINVEVNLWFSPICEIDYSIIVLAYQTCQSIFYAYSAIDVAVIVLSECLFFLRTYIMWNCRRSILYIISALALLGFVPLAAILAAFLSTVTIVESPVSKLSGCLTVKESYILLSGTFVIVIVTEIVISALIAIRVTQGRPHFGLLMKTIIHGGAIYCFCVTLFSIANMALCLVHGTTEIIFDIYQASFHAILATRLQLHLASIHELEPSDTGTRISSVQFERRVMNRPESHICELVSRRR
ncbi:hypothetical protein CONPUDRAFT_165811 [Coniophora puteana RWD-64-598 SS2]|uniref:DUF6533 domain-containing protein n=1 Tax=Coniophora puteana (strain RWD-64-598) TaxID=741705 RepID=A0A5M3MM79_CONPW|nr:uncharacterized protein CONPUDRAFT_165811 [Coniophora puteana RWD-64-598 SS2]EIW80223.1 hypothetical protein CONPUDRAFT_165811 [Coniophora puteana RWD-64-598 SS2]